MASSPIHRPSRTNPPAPGHKETRGRAGEGRRSRRILQRLGLVVAGLAVGLLLAEAALRILGIRPERYPPPQWQVWSRNAFRDTDIWGEGRIKRPSRFASLGVRMGEYVPGAKFRCLYATNPRGYFDADNGVTMTVDRWGMRSRATDCSRQKPEGTFRVLLLGDSFTFGVGVKDGDTFARGLERDLNRADSKTGRHLEILNAGVQGYNTRDEILYLMNEWLAFSPDLVLIVFYINDAYADDTILNNGEALGIYLQQPKGMARWVRLWDLAQHRYRSWQTGRTVEAFYKQHYFAAPRTFLESPGDMRVDWMTSRAALERAAGWSREKGFRLGLVIFPELYRLNDRHPFLGIHKLVARTCRDLDVPVLDLFETTFRGHDAARLWAHPSDHHPNEIAHRMAAKAITAFLKRTDLLSETGSEPDVFGPPPPAP